VSTEPTCSLRTSSVFFRQFPVNLVICPTFSSSVILLKQFLRCRGSGRWHGWQQACLGTVPKAIPTQPSTARRATSRERRAPEGRDDCAGRLHRERHYPGGARAEDVVELDQSHVISQAISMGRFTYSPSTSAKSRSRARSGGP